MAKGRMQSARPEMIPAARSNLGADHSNTLIIDSKYNSTGCGTVRNGGFL